MEGQRLKLKDVPPINTLVLVTWADAWFKPSADLKENGLQTYIPGFIRMKNKNGIKLGVETSETAEWRNFHFIPLGMIKKIEVLKSAREIEKLFI